MFTAADNTLAIKFQLANDFGLRGHVLWPPYVIGQAIIFLTCGFFFYLSSSFLFA